MSQVTATECRQLIEHACSLALGYGASGREDVRREYIEARDAAIEAILPLIDPAGGGEGKAVVKPLEWDHPGNSRCQAQSVAGLYIVAHDGDEPEEWSWTRKNSVFSHTRSAETQEKAMAGAQADFEARILSALTLPPASDSEKLIEALVNDEDLGVAIHEELKRQQAFSIEKHGQIALAEAPFVELIANALLRRMANG